MMAQLSKKEQERIDRELWESAEYGHLEKVKEALQKGANFKYCHKIRDSKGRFITLITPHTNAYINGHNTIVQLLEDAGATSDYDEILLAATARGLIDIVKDALKKNANINGQDPDHLWTALHYASSNGNFAIIEFLLQSNANPNIYNKWGQSPLHIAYWYSHDKIVKLLLSFGARDMDQLRNDDLLLTSAENGDIENVTLALTLGANVNVKHSQCQQTALHLALKKGHCDIAQLLLNSNADPNICDMFQQTALHIASEGRHCDIVQLLLKSNADPNICDEGEQTALHLASKRGYCDIVQLLLNSNADPNISDMNQETALHLASKRGRSEIVQLLLKSNADPNICDMNQQTALHLASEGNRFGIVELLLNSNADPNICDKYQQTVLHLASKKNHCNIIQLLLNFNADPNICDMNGQRPAHHAVQKGHVDALKLFIEMGQVDVNVTDKSGDSLLHLACANSNTDTISYLLYTGKVNPLARNNHQKTPLEEVRLNDPNRLEILKMFAPFEKSRQDYPVDSYRKVFICGNKTAGKSSLAQCIIYRADKPPDYHYNPSQCVEGVQLETAGINYHNVRSHEVGNIILYDFAGHQEYYSSHAAVLENLMVRTPAVFIIVIDSTRGRDYFKKQLYYWFNFIENVCATLIKPSQVIVVGSHVDQFVNSYDESITDSFVDHVVKDAIRKQEYRGFVAMQCHCPGGKGFPEFVVHLHESCNAVLDKSDNISYYCHVHYAYLKKLQKVAISLSKLIKSLKDLDDPSLPSDEAVLVDYLSTLSDKGLILFLKNEIVANSWIVIDKPSLLAKVNGILFNQNIKCYSIPTSSNTGIVHVSVLQELFQDYDTNMLIDFLKSMEFCHVIDSDTLNTITTNLSSSDHISSVDVLFFPALITAEPPSDLNDHFTSGFGWCLYCPNKLQFLSVRFLHVLLLRLAYLFCLPRCRKVGELDTTSPVLQLNRRCTVWKNGIFWKHRNDVVVEVTNDNRCVTVFVSNVQGTESQKIFCSIIKIVLSLQKQFCPCKIEEYIIPSGSLSDIRSKAISERILYKLNDVARGMLVNEEIFNHNEVQDSSINVRYICPYEPYISLAPAVIHALFSTSKINQIIPQRYLEHIKEFAPSIMSSYNTSKDSTYSAVASHLNDYSFFTGQNPLVLSSTSLTKGEIIEVSKDRLQSRNISTLKEKCPEKCDLIKLMARIAFQWYIIGECLGIQYTHLASLQSKTSRDIDKLAEVLQIWMDTMPKAVTWNTILQIIESPPIESKSTIMKIEEFLKSKTKGNNDICNDDLLEILTITEDVTQTDQNTTEQQSDEDVTQTDKNTSEQQKYIVDETPSEFITVNKNTVSVPAKRNGSFFHSSSKKLKQSDDTDNEQLDASVIVTTDESDLKSINWVESIDKGWTMELQEKDYYLREDKVMSPSSLESSTKQKKTSPGSCKRKLDSNFCSDDLPETKKLAQEQQESNVRGGATQTDKSTIDEQADGINEGVSDSITEDTVSDANPHRIVNKLVSAKLLPSNIKKNVKSTTDIYDKADKIVETLQGLIDDAEHPIELLKKICDFLLEQTDLKDIGTKMMSQL